MAAQARSYSKGIFPPGYDSAGGLDEGMITQFTTPHADSTPQAILPSGTAPWLQTFYGVVMARSNIGGTGATAGEALAFVRQGLARVRLGVNQAMTRGAQLIADATTLGATKARTAYSHSANVLGFAEEALSSSAAYQILEAYIQPHPVEVVRPVTVSQPLKTTAIGAATAYGSGLGLAFSAAQVMLYRARYTGEVVRALSASLVTAPGGADTVAVTVQKSIDNGGTWSDLAVTCTISAALKTATDLVNTATLAAGDILAVKLISSAGTAAGCVVSFDVT